MNDTTKHYREAQFEKIDEEYSEYKTKVKFIKPNGETNWMDIENSEFEKIKDILTGKLQNVDVLLSLLQDAHDLLVQYKKDVPYKRSTEYCSLLSKIEKEGL